MQAGAKALQERCQQLLPHQQWGAPGRLPPKGHFAFEGLQVARYEEGQHFKAHDDGFPDAAVAHNRFQRRATVLVYLNDVHEGVPSMHVDLCPYFTIGAQATQSEAVGSGIRCVSEVWQAPLQQL